MGQIIKSLKTEVTVNLKEGKQCQIEEPVFRSLRFMQGI